MAHRALPQDHEDPEVRAFWETEAVRIEKVAKEKTAQRKLKSRRERIATAALQGVCANSAPFCEKGSVAAVWPKYAAHLAVEAADALMAELDKGEGEADV